ncbi:MAG: xanthine dehydrogenase family protein subunit M, partial [Rhodospirillales bacterium]|nr:xanthine dehydrogenase family protein subunit M [Rhodospirillales bacterium]
AVPAATFHRLPADTPHIETVLAPGEMITAISLPLGALSRQSRYLKVRDRSSYEYASVSVAAAADFAPDGTIRDARLALGGLAAKPWPVTEAALLLAGRRPDDPVAMGRLMDAAVDGARPRSGNAYKVPQARSAIRRAFATLARRSARSVA